ncbi:MAG TPA: protein kinase [Thermoanaerobaculia bacterium]|nr:protein kinase [Thermoanaerobaculia bacterium]
MRRSEDDPQGIEPGSGGSQERSAEPERGSAPSFATGGALAGDLGRGLVAGLRSARGIAEPDLIGVELGHHRVLAEVGAGGMGRVYVAEDLRLKRRVALKVLPPEVAEDAQRLERFQREAEMLATLSHPGIVTVFSVEQDQGLHFLTMELVDGETLRRRIAQGPLEIAEATELAVELASALTAAHERGITHRDLKPDNVMVDREGRVKVLDFGIAKALQTADAPDAAGSTLTRPGLLIGTVSYMSPEQASGRTVDFRSDQFSFGVVLFEMLTGTRAFRGEDTDATLEAILRSEPPSLRETRPDTPAPLRWIVERCLEKDPGRRFAATRDLWLELAAQRERTRELTAEGAPPPVRSRRGGSLLRVLVGSSALLAFVVAGLWTGMARRDRLEPFGPLTAVPLATEAGIQAHPAFSPDGRSVAYTGEVEGLLQIFVRSVDAPVAVQVTHTRADGWRPFWSSDGRRVFYVSEDGGDESLWAVGATGGEPQRVLGNVSAGALSPDGATLALLRRAPDRRDAFSLWLASPPDAEPVAYRQPPFDDLAFWRGYLGFSPDSATLGVWVGLWDFRSELWLVPVAGGAPRRALERFSDDPSPSPFAWLPDGRRVVAAIGERVAHRRRLWLADTRTGAAAPLTLGAGAESYPAIAPGGDRLAMTVLEVNYDIVELPLDGSPPRPLLDAAISEHFPAWSPTGDLLAWVTDRNGANEIWLRSTREGWERPLVHDASFPGSETYLLDEPVFSPDGTRLAFQRWGDGGFSIWICPVVGGAPIRLVTSETFQGAPDWSPDGAAIAFLAGSIGDYRLAVARLGGNEVREVAADLLYVPPRWSPGGGWIAAQRAAGLTLFTPDGSVERVLDTRSWRAVVWSRDGERLLGVRTEGRSLVLDEIEAEGGSSRTLTRLPTPSPWVETISAIEAISLAADGRRLAISLMNPRADLWMLERAADAKPGRPR